MWPWRKSRSRKVAVLQADLAPRRVRARFDAAQTTPDNRRHWAAADGLSADAAASPAIRRILRNRSRHEVGNNCYGRGIVKTLADDVIGTGPRLQMLAESAAVNDRVERAFTAWAKAVNLPAKLRTMRVARAQDGEAFAMLFTNPVLRTAVKLDLRLIEADQVATPDLRPDQTDAVDGIVFDGFGNPREYHVLKAHPGSLGLSAMNREYDRVEAKYVIHWLRQDRAGQRRGLPELMPSLVLMPLLRRYTVATVQAAESAASIGVVMKTNLPADGEAADVPPLTEMPFESNTALFAAEGWEPSQIKAEQPATTYEMGKREILGEIARPVSMPYNIAACNSAGHNFASGKLDHSTYFKAMRIDQVDCEIVILDRILEAWLEEAEKALRLGPLEGAEHQWFWESRDPVDPGKEASAQDKRLGNASSNLAIEYARQGRDWETELRQRGNEVALMKELEIPIPGAKPAGGEAPDAGDAAEAAAANRGESIAEHVEELLSDVEI